MIKRILIFLMIFALLSTMLLPLVAGLADASSVAVPTIPQPEFLPGPTQDTTGSGVQDYALSTAIPKALNIGLGILGIGAFVGLLIAAIRMLTAYGDETKITTAKNAVRYILTGFLFSILAYAMVSITVSIALPNTDESSTSWIPSAYAVDVENDLGTLLPSQKVIIQDQDEQGRVALPNGDFLGEVVPAAVTNLMYAAAFLIFISFVYGGTLIVLGRGNEEEVTKAKSIVLYSAIALSLISLGYGIIYGIATLNFTQDSTTTSDDVFTDSTAE